MDINSLLKEVARKFAEEALDSNQEMYKENADDTVSEAEFIIGMEDKNDELIQSLLVSELERLVHEEYQRLCEEAYGKSNYHRYGSQK